MLTFYSILLISLWQEMARQQLYGRLAGEQKAADVVVDNLMQEPLKDAPVPPPEEGEGEPSRKRRRGNQKVDYRELYEQMKKEGFAS